MLLLLMQPVASVGDFTVLTVPRHYARCVHWFFVICFVPFVHSIPLNRSDLKCSRISVLITFMTTD